MTDSYLGIASIANDLDMNERMRAAASQQVHLGEVSLITDPMSWVATNRYLWASSPTWAEKWDYALAANLDNPDYEPGKDPAVITDDDILATVQALGNLQVPAE
jgi:hypothetical protein